MIFKRAVAKLRAQDWTAIGVELAIVVLGVFIGTWVANWNQERESRAETHHLLIQLKPEIDRIVDYSAQHAGLLCDHAPLCTDRAERLGTRSFGERHAIRHRGLSGEPSSRR